MAAFGTSGGERFRNDEIAAALNALLAVPGRLAVPVDMPWWDLSTFCGGSPVAVAAHCPTRSEDW